MLKILFKLEKDKYRACDWIHIFGRLRTKTYLWKLLKVYKNSSPLLATVYNCIAVCVVKRGRISLDYDPSQGRPKSASITEIVAKVQDMILDD